ncbi:MAG: ABC transporter ATP-binding protein [Ruminococcaceae bacterium]|nr:ABC transporter ATP-binding protein [Oscillospiraceae bacterium]
MKYIEAIRLSKQLPEDSYLNSIPAVEWLADEYELAFNKPVTFFVGENGTGKSTLLEAIAVGCGFNPEGGTRNFSFSTNATHSELCDHLTVSRGIYRPKDGFFLRAESMYNAATYIDDQDKTPACAPPIIDSYGGVSLHNQSHGESFLAVVQNRFGGNGLYILDEPEAALSPARLLTLLSLIHGLVQDDSQFIIATHSPILMAYPDAEILRFGQEGITPTSYRSTEHYQITKQFLDDPQKMLDIILK